MKETMESLRGYIDYLGKEVTNLREALCHKDLVIESKQKEINLVLEKMFKMASVSTSIAPVILENQTLIDEGSYR